MWLHGIGYALLAAVVAAARRADGRELLAIAAAVAALGLAGEAFQVPLTYRSPSVADAAAWLLARVR